MYVSILFVRMLLSELRRRNLPDSALLAGSAIDAATLGNLRATIPVEQWVGLLLRALEITGDPALGIALGETWSHSMLQVVGQLIVSCRTLREALSLHMRYQPLLGNKYTWRLEEQAETAALYCDDATEDTLGGRIAIEAAIILTYRIGRGFVSAGTSGADEIWFCHAEPAYAQEYARVFDCPVRFGQAHNALIFPTHVLDAIQPHGDDTMRELLSASADALLREREAESVGERVRAILRFEQDVARLDVSYIAKRLDLNVRALRRKLGAEQMPLASLLDEARLRIAQRELLKPGVSIEEVAHDLGFSEASAFHRAFKRWSGQTPAQFHQGRVLAGSQCRGAKARVNHRYA